jgi:hypothetical protein
MGYQWLVYLHISTVILFVLAHGGSAAMALRLRSEPSADGIRALVALSTLSTRVTYPLLILVLITGGILALAGHFWGRGWVWTTIAILVLTSVLMAVLSRQYHPLRGALAKPGHGREASYASSPEEIRRIASSTRAAPLTAIGFAALAGILWLMLLKPF